MHRSVLAFLVLIGLLLGSVSSSLLAHPSDDAAAHAGEVSGHLEEAENQASDDGAPSEQAPTGSGLAIHHHCSCATPVSAIEAGPSRELMAEVYLVSSVLAMPSLRSAPPIEPPAT